MPKNVKFFDIFCCFLDSNGFAKVRKLKIKFVFLFFEVLEANFCVKSEQTRKIQVCFVSFRVLNIVRTWVLMFKYFCLQRFICQRVLKG